MTAKQHYAKIACSYERGNVYEVITEYIFQTFFLLGIMHKLEQKVEYCISNGSATPITIEQTLIEISPSFSPSQY